MEVRKGFEEGTKQKAVAACQCFLLACFPGFTQLLPLYTTLAHLSKDPRAYMELGPPMPVRRLPNRYGGISLIMSPFSKADNQN